MSDQVEEIKLWSCPECGFEFNAQHEDVGGGYTCPLCQLEAALTVLRYWQPSVLSWCQRFPQDPVHEAVAAWAIIGPLLERK